MISIILEKLSDLTVKIIYRVGSISWSSTNWHDIDIAAVVEEPIDAHMRSIREMNLEVFVVNEADFKSRLVGEGSSYLSWYYGLATVHTENLLYGQLIDGYDWFKHQYKVLLSTYNSGLNTYFQTDILTKRHVKVCSKTMTLAFLIYYTILNQSFTLTEKQLDIVQRCHDRQLPLSYADELKNNIKKILQEQKLIQ